MHVAIALHLVCHLSLNMTDPLHRDYFGDFDLNFLDDLFNIPKESLIVGQSTDRNDDSEFFSIYVSVKYQTLFTAGNVCKPVCTVLLACWEVLCKIEPSPKQKKNHTIFDWYGLTIYKSFMAVQWTYLAMRNHS